MKAVEYIANIGSKLGTKSDLGIPDQAMTGLSVTTFINGVYFVAGFIAVLMLIIGGIGYVSSSGDSNKATKARGTIINAMIGIVIIILAFAITRYAFAEASK